ncbi:hypothetical protein P171DRAFT_352064 [Karstenula rhodostoma CBS 690.94]|uniref:Uncharacterized protein n=1 Tax=Karstenula rhodostoma CBS 690.94 TaxID=1392251 RepID=A0A9P4UHX0_9PLEO|nr:hypothetical protein P171DRAFT_352064 [Karstenula rhodostoma CBS 690.94]
MDREYRMQLLDGITITLVLDYSGLTTYHPQQLSAARNMVDYHRYGQLCEQAENAAIASSSAPRALVVFPKNALAAASQYFADLGPDTIYTHKDKPDTFFMDIELGQILPGYVMEVLYRYAGKLNAKTWKEFLPVEPSIQDSDKYYWLFIYVAMQKLGMQRFAAELAVPFIGILVEQHRLVDEVWVLEFMLEGLSEHDPLLELVAERYAKLEITRQSPLFHEQWLVIFKDYAHFGNCVKSIMGRMKENADEFNKAVREAERQLEGLGIEDGDSEDMES